MNNLGSRTDPLPSLTLIGVRGRVILLRAVIAALIIGSALTLVNQGGTVFGSGEIQLPRLGLAYLTPFAVVLAAQLFAVRKATIDLQYNDALKLIEEPVARTVFSRGIPLRALVIGVVAGGITTSILAAKAILTDEGLDSLPVLVLAQAFALPFFFSFPAQLIAYRSVIRASMRGHRYSEVQPEPAVRAS